MEIKIIQKNRRAGLDYELGDRFEAGIELVGTEVKSIRAGKVNLTEGWVEFRDGEAWLREVQISPYSHGNIFNHEAKRPRRLLLHRKEITKLTVAIEQKGLTVVPTILYLKGQRVKVEVALGKGKKLYDKRESTKQKDASREIQRAMKKRD
jgi:SsrA-binding protein